MSFDMIPGTKTGLSRLALEAAIEIETSAKPNLDFPKLKQFLLEVKRQFTEYKGSVFLKDAGMYNVYYNALSRNDAEGPSDRQSIVEKLKDLTSMSDDTDGDTLDQIKDFCLNVHEAIANDLLEEHEAMVSRNVH